MNKQILHQWVTSNLAYSIYSTLAVVFIYLFTYSPPPTQKVSDSSCDVIRITDGDSLIVKCKQQRHNLRLMHIDAPEITQDDWGIFARDTLAQLTPKTIFVAFHGKDIYQRDLAIIYISSNKQQSINLQMVKHGAARVYSRYNAPHRYRSAMKTAKLNQRGIWQSQGLHQDPARYRRLAY